MGIIRYRALLNTTPLAAHSPSPAILLADYPLSHQLPVYLCCQIDPLIKTIIPTAISLHIVCYSENKGHSKQLLRHPVLAAVLCTSLPISANLSHCPRPDRQPLLLVRRQVSQAFINSDVANLHSNLQRTATFPTLSARYILSSVVTDDKQHAFISLFVRRIRPISVVTECPRYS